MLSKKDRHESNPFEEVSKHSTIEEVTKVDKRSIHDHVKRFLIDEYNITKSLRLTLDYLFEINQVKKDYIFINYENFSEKTGIKSYATMSNCLGTLIDLDIIAKMYDVNGYYLNPKYFGDFDTFSISTIFTTGNHEPETNEYHEKSNKSPLITKDQIEGETVMLPFDPYYWD